MQSLQIVLGMFSVQTNIAIVTGKTKEEILTLASTPKRSLRSHPGKTCMLLKKVLCAKGTVKDVKKGTDH